MTDAQTAPAPGQGVPTKDHPAVYNIEKTTPETVNSEPVNEQAPMATDSTTNQPEVPSSEPASVNPDPVEATSEKNESSVVVSNDNQKDVDMTVPPTATSSEPNGRKRDISESSGGEGGSDPATKKTKLDEEAVQGHAETMKGSEDASVSENGTTAAVPSSTTTDPAKSITENSASDVKASEDASQQQNVGATLPESNTEKNMDKGAQPSLNTNSSSNTTGPATTTDSSTTDASVQLAKDPVATESMTGKDVDNVSTSKTGQQLGSKDTNESINTAVATQQPSGTTETTTDANVAKTEAPISSKSQTTGTTAMEVESETSTATSSTPAGAQVTGALPQPATSVPATPTTGPITQSPNTGAPKLAGVISETGTSSDNVITEGVKVPVNSAQPNNNPVATSASTSAPGVSSQPPITVPAGSTASAASGISTLETTSSIDESRPLSSLAPIKSAKQSAPNATNNTNDAASTRANSVLNSLPPNKAKIIRAAQRRMNKSPEEIIAQALDYADYDSLVKTSVISKTMKVAAHGHKNWKVYVMDLVETLHGHVAPINMLASAGSYLFSGSSDGKIKAWDTRSWCCEKTLNVTPLPEKRPDVTLAPPGANAKGAAKGGRKGAGPNRGVSGGKTKKEKQAVAVVSTQQQQPGEKVIPVMALTVHDNYLYMGLEDGRVVSRNIFGDKDMSNQMEKEVKAHNGGVRALAVSKTKVFTGGADGKIGVFALKSLELDTTFSRHKDIVTCLALNGNRLFSGSYDENIHVWNTTTLKYETSFEASKNGGHSGRINSLCTHDNKLYSAGWDCTIKVWDAKRLVLLKSVFVSPIGICWSLAVRSSKGSKPTLVCGVRDNDIEIRDLDVERNLAVLSSEVECRWATRLTEHKNWVKAVLPLDDGRIVTASADWSVKVWNFRGAPSPPKPPAKVAAQRQMIITPTVFKQLQAMRRHSPAQMLQFEIEMCANLKKYSRAEIRKIDERMAQVQQQRREQQRRAQAAAAAAGRGMPPRGPGGQPGYPPGQAPPPYGYPAQRYPPGYQGQGVPPHGMAAMRAGQGGAAPRMPMGHAQPGMAPMPVGRKPTAGRAKPKPKAGGK